MNKDELRAAQAPLKQQYQEHPETALITSHAKGDAGDGISCKLTIGGTTLEAGLHAAAGGNGDQLCSGDLLLDALVACAGVTVKAVATAMGITLTSAIIEAEGDTDFRGTLAVDRSVPVGFKAIRLNFRLQSDAEEASLNKLIELTERYCVIYQTLKAGVAIETSLQLNASD